ncbi:MULTISPECIES: sulfite exporter TauE/SafE family protein [unclassified Pseudomonas]|uniref:sulfite exporter TauE/SafE family protein n=1 Tax=unclassified Pseudomonas TaxID=196821 RepID=UPI002449370C|nr:sulfite exporter TauE/SafE family protein [Pseudomonas sp. GD03944]MDH1261864.1 sulfite exporter TauE/SafE family protein [Pseudomonas sp. GD03944]
MTLTDFLLFAVPAVFLTGLSKGGFGGALGGIAVPLLALAATPMQAVAIMLPILCLADVVGLKAYFGKWDTANLKVMMPGALIGIVIGSLTFELLNENTIGLLIGIIAISFVLLGLINTNQEPRPLQKGRGTVLSTLAGFTSFVAHAGGPPVMMHLLPQQLDKVRYVATINMFFLLTNALKLIPYTALGQFTADNLLMSLALAPIVPLGVYSGLWLQSRINHTWFYRIARLGMLLAGIQLIWHNI